MNDVSSRTAECLQEKCNLKPPDLELLTIEDIKQFGLLVGEKNRFKNAIKKLHQYSVFSFNRILSISLEIENS